MNRTIRTAAELDALPVWAAVRGEDFTEWVRFPAKPDVTGEWVSEHGDRATSAELETRVYGLTVLNDPSAPAPAPSVVPEAAVALRDVIDEALAQAIDERDAAESVADRLAARLAEVLGRPDVIGEHSSSNDPWQNVLDLPDLTAAPSATRDEVARSIPVDALATFITGHGGDFETGQWRVELAFPLSEPVSVDSWRQDLLDAITPKEDR